MLLNINHMIRRRIPTLARHLECASDSSNCAGSLVPQLRSFPCTSPWSSGGEDGKVDQATNFPLFNMREHNAGFRVG